MVCDRKRRVPPFGDELAKGAAAHIAKRKVAPRSHVTEAWTDRSVFPLDSGKAWGWNRGLLSASMISGLSGSRSDFVCGPISEAGNE